MPCCGTPPSMTSTLSCGRSNVCVYLSSNASGCHTTRPISGAFWIRSASSPNAHTDVLSNATRTPSRRGSARLGPRAKKCTREQRLIVFIDKAGLSERPKRVHTWAPKGQTPVIQFHFNRNLISAIAGLSYHNCLFRLYDGAAQASCHGQLLPSLAEVKTTAHNRLRSTQQRA